MLTFSDDILKMYANTKPAYKKVYNILKAEILSGQTASMDRLTEVGVAQALGISRTPVRAALSQLKSEGILDSVSKNGVGVKQLSRSDKAGLLYMDEVLESTAAYLAATNGSQEDIDTLFEINDTIRHFHYESVKNNTELKGVRDLHLQFHLMIAKMSGNRFLYKEVVELRSLMRMHSNDEHARPSIYVDTITPCHDKLLEALNARDPEGAKLWMRVDLSLLKSIYSDSKMQ